jgi:preprotein translocase subunit SecD
MLMSKRVLVALVLLARLSDEDVIAGSFTQENAKLLAAQLQYGALNLSLQVESIGTFENVES